MEETSIDNFAVKLKIQEESAPEDTFRNERIRNLDNLRHIALDDVKMSQLVDSDNRVTFIRGIAGMGKTVLSKQFVCKWSHNKLCNDFKVCIMFECREINVFQATEGANLREHDLLREFVKTKFNFDLGNGSEVLFVVDGLDELFDINTDKSIIMQLLNRSIYPACKVILTGRPHVENKLEACGEIGGLMKVEILGLSDEQIEEYVAKFPSPEDVCIELTSARDSSKYYLPILHIPQFLNTFCCVSSLLKGKAIRNGAELYCWAVYLLLKQHANRQNQCETKLISEIFQEYSKELLTLGKVCNKLLNENKIIILKKDIEAFLGNYEIGNDFIGSLFVDVSDNFEKRFQFKHLSLMEFLSAYHTCCSQTPMAMITDNLKNGYLEVVVFACQLISGSNSKGIIQEMIKVNAAKLKNVDGNTFCHDVIKVLNGCILDRNAIFLHSLDIIVSCLNEDVTNKAILLSTIQMLNTETIQTKFVALNQWYKGVILFLERSKKMYTIYKHLVNICKFNDNEMHAAFKHIHVYGFHVNELEMIKCVKYFGYIHVISLYGMKLNVNAARHEVETISYGQCKALDMTRCELEDNMNENQSRSSKFDLVAIHNCKLRNENSLINTFNWATSSSSSGIEYALRWLIMEDGWWNALVIAIEKENVMFGRVNLQRLLIFECTPKMSNDLERRVLYFNI